MGHAGELVERIATGATTAVAETEAAIARIEAGDGELNAVVVRDFDRARADAAAADGRIAAGERAPLLGLPMTVKESFNVAGLPTTYGFTEFRDNIAERDAVAVSRLRDAGAVILGKTNVPPGLADFQSSNPVYGATQNPHAPGWSSGGSSGGSAAAVAAGFVTAEVGTDIGGSIRIPASFCGAWGLKPTWDTITRDGHHHPANDGAGDLLSVAGPITTSPEDLDLLIGVLADHPLFGPTATSLDGLRVAVIADHPVAPISGEIRAVLDRFAGRLADRGAVVSDAGRLPDLAELHDAYLHMLGTVMSARMSSPDMEPISALQWFDVVDGQARMRRRWDRSLIEEHDVVLAPIFGIPSFPLDDLDIVHRTLDIDGTPTDCITQVAWAGMATYTGLPAVAIPAGVSSSGIPIGLQLIGPRHRDRNLIQLAALAAAE